MDGAFASNICDPSSIPVDSVSCGLSAFLVGFLPAARFFSGFAPFTETNTSNSSSIWTSNETR